MEIEWNDVMTVGVQEIDEQHQTLIDAINRMGEVMLGEQQPDDIREILTFAVQYAQTHFEYEEAYFDQYESPETQANKKAHAEFTTTANSLLENFQQQGVDMNLIINTHRFLVDWLMQHILDVDSALRKFVQ